MKIKAVIHDWDDTITNSFESYTQFYFDFGKFHQLCVPEIASIKEHWGGTIPEIIQGVWPNLTMPEIEKKTATFIEELKLWRKIYTAAVFPDIKETILNLDKLGIKLGVISSGDSAQMKRIYKEQINEDLKPHIFIYDNKELGYKKPDPKIFDKAFEQLSSFGISEEETIYVGDSFQDYYSAKNRGLIFYAVTTGLKTREDFIKEGVPEEQVLSRFNDLLNLCR